MNKIYDGAAENDRNFGSYSLKDEEVKDALVAIARVSDDYRVCVVGGITIDLYCWPEEPERETNDIDMDIAKYLTKGKFKRGIGRDISEELENLGYSPHIWTGGRSFGMNVLEDDEKGVLFISLPNRSRKRYESYLPIFEREYENSMKIKIPDREEKVPVISYEDAIAPKLKRLELKDTLDINCILRAMEKSGRELNEDYLEESLYDWNFGIEDLVKYDLKKLERIRNERDPVKYYLENLEDMEKI